MLIMWIKPKSLIPALLFIITGNAINICRYLTLLFEGGSGELEDGGLYMLCYSFIAFLVEAFSYLL